MGKVGGASACFSRHGVCKGDNEAAAPADVFPPPPRSAQALRLCRWPVSAAAQPSILPPSPPLFSVLPLSERASESLVVSAEFSLC